MAKLKGAASRDPSAKFEGGFEAFEVFEGEGSKGGGGLKEGRLRKVGTKASKPLKGEDEGFEGFEG